MNTGAVSSISEKSSTAMEKAYVNNRFIIKVSSVAALGGLLFGFDTAIISGVIPHIMAYFKLDEYTLGWTVSSILIGCATGALVSGKLADRFGRRNMLIACAILFAISGIGSGLSHHLYELVLFRLVGGLGVGAAAMLSPIYIAEMAPASWRGTLVAFYQLAIVSGILLAYFTAYMLDGIGTNNWRWMFSSQAFPSLLFWLLLLLVPETPRWLIKKGYKREAAEILNITCGAVAAETEIKAIENSFAHKTGASIKQLFSKPYRSVLFLGMLVAVFQQATGINAILYYAPVIFREMGLNSPSSLLQTIGIGAINVLATLIAIVLVDKIGRKKFLLGGSFIMGISLFIVGLCFQHLYFNNYIILIFMLLYVGCFGCTLGAVTWVYLSEIFPNRVRGLAMSVATLALWLTDFMVTWSFPTMTKQLGTAATLYCYAGLCAAASFYILLKVQETKGRSLEEIELLFIKPQSIKS